eukprot:4497678-Prymnesium_polylepis.1
MANAGGGSVGGLGTTRHISGREMSPGGEGASQLQISPRTAERVTDCTAYVRRHQHFGQIHHTAQRPESSLSDSCSCGALS